MKSGFITALATWIAVIFGIRVFTALSSIPVIKNNLGTIVAVLLVYPPVIISFFSKTRIAYWGFNKDVVIKNLKWFLIMSVIVFPAILLGNHFYQQVFFDKNFQWGSSDLWVMFTVTQLLLIAFPEEFFFRGYLQEAFHKRFPPKRKVFGVSFGMSTVMVALIFALSHSVITLQWWHCFIFFPALLFGWLKEKTGTIWAAVLFHWICNLFSFWVNVNYS